VIAEDEYQQWKNPKAVPNNHNETSHHFSPAMAKRFAAFQEKYLDFEKNEKSSHQKKKAVSVDRKNDSVSRTTSDCQTQSFK